MAAHEGRTLHLRHRGKRQSCTTSRFRLTAHPRLPGRSRTLSLICVVKEILQQRRETAVTARGRRNGLAIKGLSAEAVQLPVGSVYRGTKRQCHGFLLFSNLFTVIPAMAISTLSPCTQSLLRYGFNRSGHGGGAAMPWLPSIFKFTLSHPSNGDISPTTLMSGTAFHLATNVN